MAPNVDLSDLQNTVGNIIEQHRALVAAGPVAVGVVSKVVTKNKLISNTIIAGGTLVAVQQLAGPYLKLMHEQFGYLMSMLGH